MPKEPEVHHAKELPEGVINDIYNRYYHARVKSKASRFGLFFGCGMIVAPPIIMIAGLTQAPEGAGKVPLFVIICLLIWWGVFALVGSIFIRLLVIKPKKLSERIRNRDFTYFTGIATNKSKEVYQQSDGTDRTKLSVFVDDIECTPLSGEEYEKIRRDETCLVVMFQEKRPAFCLTAALD